MCAPVKLPRWAMVCLLLASRQATAQPLRIEVGGATFRPYPVAVPPLAMRGGEPPSTAALGRGLTQMLQGGVDLVRSLELVPPKTYLRPEAEAVTAPNFTAWAQVGASGLIRGTLQSDGPKVKTTLRFYDVRSRAEVFHEDCEQSPAQARLCVHRFLDQVVERLTGERGIFSSRLSFVRKANRQAQVYTSDIDGQNVERVSERGSLNLLPGWDSQGRYVLFTSYAGGNPDLVRVDLRSRRLQTLSAARGLNMGGAVSPDGAR
ncbi:MAG: hypothetical protein EOO40_09000, partial [Deltaproteobacteria bacterium]